MVQIIADQQFSENSERKYQLKENIISIPITYSELQKSKIDPNELIVNWENYQKLLKYKKGSELSLEEKEYLKRLFVQGQHIPHLRSKKGQVYSPGETV